ncbi:hypothetical protein TRIUR3_31919 [Triticum urartu]|uniref:Uncharacterized protein n=1 Tax=Triticum urartu TaxID=4572 RepID=M8A5Z0_TRIUA|nr:hypothetical protein TRIUR3_31919 [Triticum urartu]
MTVSENVMRNLSWINRFLVVQPSGLRGRRRGGGGPAVRWIGGDDKVLAAAVWRSWLCQVPARMNSANILKFKAGFNIRNVLCPADLMLVALVIQMLVLHISCTSFADACYNFENPLLFTVLGCDGQIVASPYPDPKVTGSIDPDAQVAATPNLDAPALGNRALKMHSRGFNILEIFETGREKMAHVHHI